MGNDSSSLPDEQANICDINLSHIMFGTHHKSGTVLFNRFFRNYIGDYIHSKCPNISSAISTDNGLSVRVINDFMSQHSQDDIVIFHVIRDPIDMILSGFNYHLKANEKWLHKPLLKELQHRQSVSRYQSKGNFTTETALHLLCSAQIIFNLIESNDSTNHMVNYTIQQIYNALDTKSGIYYEYKRFVKCNYDVDIHDSYLRIKELANYPNIGAANMRLESFANHYNESCRKLLNMMQINDKLDQIKLLDAMSQSDKSRAPNKPSINNHATDGTFDKQKQIEFLIEDRWRCLHLKNMTLLLDYTWKYSKYC